MTSNRCWLLVLLEATFATSLLTHPFLPAPANNGSLSLLLVTYPTGCWSEMKIYKNTHSLLIPVMGESPVNGFIKRLIYPCQIVWFPYNRGWAADTLSWHHAVAAVMRCPEPRSIRTIYCWARLLRGAAPRHPAAILPAIMKIIYILYISQHI